MYEDRRETFSIKDLFLQLLFIVLLVFILIWLFPTKGYLEKKLDGIEVGLNEKLKPLYTRLFTENILTMKDAAKSYFTTPRLPQKVGDKVTMTLEEMYEKGLLLELVDSNNNACDAKKSYVEITKTSDEYELKTSLTCSDKEAFIIEHLGCYDYCNGKLCTKEESKTNQVKTYTCKVVNGQYWGAYAKVVDAATYNAQCVKQPDRYRYEYMKVTGGSCTFVPGSDWTTTKIEASDSVKVETKTEKEIDHYDKEKVLVDTKYREEKYIEEVPYELSTKTKEVTKNYSYEEVKYTETAQPIQRETGKTHIEPFAKTTVQVTECAKTGNIKRVTGSATVPTNGGCRAEWFKTNTEFDCAGCETYKAYYYYEYAPKKVSKEQADKTCSTIANSTPTNEGCLVHEVGPYCPEGTLVNGNCEIPRTRTQCPAGTTEKADKTGCYKTKTEKEYYCAGGDADKTADGKSCVAKVEKTKKVPELIYDYVDKPVYKEVTYYKSSVKKCTDGSSDTKWSESNNDQTLKSQGYTLTGKTEKI